MLKINTLPGTGIRAILYCWHWWIDKLHLLPCIYKTGVQLHLKIKYCNVHFFTLEMKKFSLLSECSTCCYFGFVFYAALLHCVIAMSLFWVIRYIFEMLFLLDVNRHEILYNTSIIKQSS